MSNKKIILLLILSIFIVGMVLSPANASHTFKMGKYSATISDKQYNTLKDKAKKGKSVSLNVKTGDYKTYKKPKYKTVKKKKWTYKTVLRSKLVFSKDWKTSKSYDYNIKKYWNNWKWYGSKNTQSKDGHTIKYYEKFKKKVTKKVKVKDGYKKVKKPVYMTISNVDETGHAGKKLFATDLHTEYERL